MSQKRAVGVLLLASFLAGGAMPALAKQGVDDSQSQGALVTPTVTREQAIATAKTKLDGTVRKAELERDHNRAVWKIRILSTDMTQRGDFRINALTGDILRFRIKTVHGNGEKVALKVKSAKDSQHEANDNHGRRHGGRGADDNR